MTAYILDQAQVTKYFCRMSLVTYLVYYRYSNAGSECQARARRLYMGILLQIQNYPQFILNQYQEVGKKLAYTTTPKNIFFKRSSENAFNLGKSTNVVIR